jgi:hypothetical protein
MSRRKQNGSLLFGEEVALVFFYISNFFEPFHLPSRLSMFEVASDRFKKLEVRMVGKIWCGLWILIGSAALGACNSDSSQGGSDWVWPHSTDSNVPDDTSAGSGDGSGNDTGPGRDTNSSQPVDSDSVCAELMIDIEMVPARLMILQDLSGSMTEDEFGGDGSPSKWEQARSALISLLGNNKVRVDWGFDSFPSNDDCGVRLRGLIDTKANNKAIITASLAILSPGGGTPLYRAMQNYTRKAYAPNFLSLDASSYLLVVSDGADTCGINGVYDEKNGATPTQLANMTSRLLTSFGVKTYVIGFGNGAETAQLNAIAAAGGTERNTFFDAKNKVQLSNALMNIVSSVVSCVYDLKGIDETKVDPDTVNFYFDGEVVKMDKGCASNVGWTWVGSQKKRVEFCKAACDELQTGEVDTISAKYGCPQVVVQ